VSALPPTTAGSAPGIAAPRPLPAPLRASAACFVLYGLLVALNSTLNQVAGGWAYPSGYALEMARAGGMLLGAFGLMRARRWGFWLAIVLGMLWLGASLVAAVVLLLLMDPAMRGPLEPRQVAILLASVAVLGAALVLLLVPASRAAFTRGDAA
jgi:hypothetical protein